MSALTILAGGNHANALLANGNPSNTLLPPTGGQTYMFPFVGGTIPLEKQAKGSAIDCSAITTLRGLTLTVTDMTAIPAGGGAREDEQGRHDSSSLRVSIETAPTTGGPWVSLHTFTPMNSRGEQRAPIALHPDVYVRASWFFMRYGLDGHTTVRDDVRFSFSVTADALP